MKKIQTNKYDLVLINTPNAIGPNTIRLGLLTIAAYVRQYGFTVTILDGSLWSIKRQIVNLDLNNTVVGLTATTDVAIIAYNLCKFIKKHYSSACCILGGFHATALPEQTLDESDFDLIVFGEGELTMLDILNAYKNKSGLENISGTVIRKNGLIIRNKPRELIRNLDILPRPAYDLIQIEKHFGGIRCERVSFKRCLYLLVSRGCLFDCVFCDSKIMWERKLRWHSLDYIIGLIKHAVQEFNIDSIAFLDDELLCDKNRVIAFTDYFVKSGLAKRIKWECQARVKSVDKEMLIRLKESGCQLVRFGIESGSQKSLTFLKKGTNKVEDCFKAVQLCREVGLPAFGSFIIGSPQEDVEDIMQTIYFIEKSGLSSAALFVATPYPGTDLFKLCKENKYFIPDIKWTDFMVEGNNVKSVIRNNYFTAQQLRYIRDYINITVIRPLNMGKKPRKLDHRKEIMNILSGKFSFVLKVRIMFAQIKDNWRKGIRRPHKILPYVMSKIMKIEKITGMFL